MSPPGSELSPQSEEPHCARGLQAQRRAGGRQRQGSQDHQLWALGLQELLHWEHDGGGRGVPQPAPGPGGPHWSSYHLILSYLIRRSSLVTRGRVSALMCGPWGPWCSSGCWRGRPGTSSTSATCTSTGTTSYPLILSYLTSTGTTGRPAPSTMPWTTRWELNYTGI